jgi:hypothetical protein
MVKNRHPPLVRYVAGIALLATPTLVPLLVIVLLVARVTPLRGAFVALVDMTVVTFQEQVSPF